MSLLRLTDDGTDLFRPAGAKSFERISGAEQARIHMRCRLRLFKGEVFRDQRIGVDVIDFVSLPTTSTEQVANHINAIALGTPGIVESQLRFEVLDTELGIIDIEADAVYSADDQSERVPIHENIQIRRSGGSIPE